MALLIALVPLSILAADFAFLDLNSGSPHNDNIAAIKAAGITKGCNPPAYDNYCPNGLVTREEMASFLARTAGLGGNPPVANAQTAANASAVGGYAPSGIARVAMARKNTETILTPAAAPVLVLTLKAPTAGFLHATSTSVASTDSPGPNCRVRHYLRDDQNTGPQSAAGTHHANGVTAELTTAQTYVFTVAPGTRTVTMFAFYEGTCGTGTVIAKELIITALFTPFGYDGGTTLAP